MSSGHLIKPVFDMARRLNAQLICLSDIRNEAVLGQFGVRYELSNVDIEAKRRCMKAVRLTRPVSYGETRKQLEEAHFRTEQITLEEFA